MKNPFDVQGKVIVVTGAKRGIGRGLAAYFAEQGATVVGMARNEESAAEYRKQIEKSGEKIDVFVMDNSNADLIAPAFDKVVEKYGKIDVLVNNVSYSRLGPALEVTADYLDKAASVAIRGTFLCSQAAARHMIPRKYGRIINISSQAGIVAIENESVYCMMKAAMNQMTRAFGLEWGRYGVTVNAVAPTFTYTPSTKERLDNPEISGQILAKIPRGVFGQIEDVAAAVHYLCSEHSGMANGSILVIDGGWTVV